MINKPTFLKGFLAFLLLGLFSCSSEIDILTGNYQPIPVITALINPWDSVHSVRVQKTFLIRDKEGAKLQDSDSLYFNDVDVRMVGILGDQEMFSYDFVKKSIDKDSGMFTGKNHHVYQLNDTLPLNLPDQDGDSFGNPDIDYLLLEVDIHDIDTTISRKIPVYSPVMVSNKPRHDELVLYSEYKTKLYSYSQSRMGGRLRAGELEFRFNILEIEGEESYERVFTYKIDTARFYKFRKPELLYNKIMMSLDLSNQNITSRIFKSMDVHWTLAEVSYNEYTSILSFWQGMIDYPYSQIPGMYGMIIAKVSGQMKGIKLAKQTMDSLCYGQAYKHLNFRTWD